MAKRVIANLSIQIGASSATLSRDLKSARGAVQRFGADVRKSGGALNGLDVARGKVTAGLSSFTSGLKGAAFALTGMVAGAAAAALSVRGVFDQFDRIDALAKTADKLGETTGALAGFHHAAEQTGVSTETANAALQRMTRRIAEAAAGSGAAKNALGQLGLNAQQLASMTPTQAFSQLSEAFRGVQSSSERVKLAFALFGAEGVNLLNTLNLGSAGLANMQKEAESLGLAIDRSAAAKVEAANDAMHRMQQATTGLAQQLAVALAPAVVAVADQLTKFVQWLGNLDLQTVKTVAQTAAFVGGLGAVLTVAPRVIGAIRAIIAAVRAMTIAGTLAQGVTGFGLLKVAAGLAAAGGIAYGVGKAFDKLSGDMQQTNTAAVALGHNLQQALPEPAELAEPIDDAAEAMSRLRDETDRWAQIGERITASVATPFEKAQEQLLEVREALRRGTISAEIYQRAVQKLVDDLNQAEAGGRGLAQTPRGPVGAVVRGTSGAYSQVRESIDQARKMDEHLKKIADKAAKREKQLQDLLDATAAVEDAVRESVPEVVQHRI